MYYIDLKTLSSRAIGKLFRDALAAKLEPEFGSLRVNNSWLTTEDGKNLILARYATFITDGWFFDLKDSHYTAWDSSKRLAFLMKEDQKLEYLLLTPEESLALITRSKIAPADSAKKISIRRAANGQIYFIGWNDFILNEKITPLDILETTDDGHSGQPETNSQSWLFQANPKLYDIDSALEQKTSITWTVNQFKNDIHNGDTAYIWKSGKPGGIIAKCQVITEPREMQLPEDEQRYLKLPDKFAGVQLRVIVKKLKLFNPAISRDSLWNHPILRNLSILKNPQGTNYVITQKQADALEHFSSPRHFWWVNHWKSADTERNLGLIWAPKKTINGGTKHYYDSLGEVQPGDVVVHYTNKAIRYASIAKSTGLETVKPAGITGYAESTLGTSVQLEYHELKPPVPIDRIQQALKGLDILYGPLTSKGGVNQGYLFRLTPHAFDLIQSVSPDTNWPHTTKMPQLPKAEVLIEYSLETCATETGYTPEQLQKWVDSINRKKQAILYGPPGTGKTFLAERLALLLSAGGNMPPELIQFHPSYAYEDFIQGLRPKVSDTGSIRYSLEPGRFYDFCERARRIKNNCVLIIDEINRANLSRVFGELMFLLEYRNKKIHLASGGQDFSIPENVRIIGTMNTADRSIALVDYALRRRFSFIPMIPNYDLLKKFHANSLFNTDKLVAELETINSKIDDVNYQIGVTFFLRPDLETYIEDIWNHEIYPYLEEYFFDRHEQIRDFKWEHVLKRLNA